MSLQMIEQQTVSLQSRSASLIAGDITPERGPTSETGGKISPCSPPASETCLSLPTSPGPGARDPRPPDCRDLQSIARQVAEDRPCGTQRRLWLSSDTIFKEVSCRASGFQFDLSMRGHDLPFLTVVIRAAELHLKSRMCDLVTLKDGTHAELDILCK